MIVVPNSTPVSQSALKTSQDLQSQPKYESPNNGNKLAPKLELTADQTSLPSLHLPAKPSGDNHDSPHASETQNKAGKSAEKQIQITDQFI